MNNGSEQELLQKEVGLVDGQTDSIYPLRQYG